MRRIFALPEFELNYEKSVDNMVLGTAEGMTTLSQDQKLPSNQSIL